MIFKLQMAVIISILLLASGCKKETPTEIAKEIPGKENHTPKILAVNAEPNTLYVNAESILTCIATDEDGDTLKIVWSCEKGTLPNGNNGKTVKYTSPSSIGIDIITVKVNDSKLSVESKFEINVVEKGSINHPAKIVSLTAIPDTILLGQQTTLNCVAEDEDGDNLRIWWEGFKGWFSGNVGPTVKFTTTSGGIDTIKVYISDEKVITKGKLPINILSKPSPPLLISPLDGESNTSLSPLLLWKKGDAVSFTLQVSKDYYFKSFIINESDIRDTSKQLTNLEMGVQYYWRLIAINKIGNSGWSKTVSFTTVRPPYAPNLSGPYNGEKVLRFSLKFSWQTTLYANNYCLQVSENPNFNSFVYNKNDLTVTHVELPWLTEGKEYYWRVSASNFYGTSPFSVERLFKVANIGNVNPTSCGNATYVEYQGKKYNIVQIGTQCWFKENLNVGNITSKNTGQTDNGTLEKYCYNDEEKNCEIYGGLYLWEEAMNYKSNLKAQGICPEGWHIPTLYEMWILDDFVKGNSNELKSVGQGTGDGKGNNTSGFSALLGGYYFPNYTFQNIQQGAYFWVSGDDINQSVIWSQCVSNDNNKIEDDCGSPYFGFSIRCIKD